MDMINLFNIIDPAWWLLLLLPLVGYICWANPYEYNSFEDCVTAIGGNEATIMIPNEQAITDNLIVPANITLKPIQGGTFNVSAGKTLTINGYIDAGEYPIFDGAGTIAITTNQDIYGEWFVGSTLILTYTGSGHFIVPTGLGDQGDAALRGSLAWGYGNAGIRVCHLPDIQITATTTINILSNKEIIGGNFIYAKLYSTADPILSVNNQDAWRLERIILRGNDTNSAIDISNTSARYYIDKVFFSHLAIGMDITYSWINYFTDLYFGIDVVQPIRLFSPAVNQETNLTHLVRCIFEGGGTSTWAIIAGDVATGYNNYQAIHLCLDDCSIEGYQNGAIRMQYLKSLNIIKSSLEGMPYHVKAERGFRIVNITDSKLVSATTRSLHFDPTNVPDTSKIVNLKGNNFGANAADLLTGQYVEKLYKEGNCGIAAETIHANTEINEPGGNMSAPSSITIAGGAITRTRYYHILTPQGGAVDDLDTINGGEDGMLLLLKGDGTFQIDVKHNTGNILLTGAADYLLPTTTERILLQYDAALTKWIQLSEH